MGIILASKAGLSGRKYRQLSDLPLGYSIGYMVVAGGGAGGSSNNRSSGAGGAGGLLTSASYLVSPGSYTVTVGSGGAKPTGTTGHGSDPFGQTGGSGSNSVFGDFTAIGGGGGSVADGANGGSGGGEGGLNNASYTPGSGTEGQGNDGGSGVSQFVSGGGGGAGGPGEDSDGSLGEGVISTLLTVSQANSWAVGEVSGPNVWFASGGAGAGRGTAELGGGGNANGGNAAAKTGGGGAGGAGAFAHTYGGNGGSGVVIIRTITADAQPTIGAGLTYSSGNAGNYTVYAFTAGTDTVTWPAV